MNFDQAKRILLGEVLHILGFAASQEETLQSQYYSPLHEEPVASLFVYHESNTWYDKFLGKGGNSIDFVREYLKTQNVGHEISDALRWLKNMLGYASIIQPLKDFNSPKSDIRLKIRDRKPLEHIALIRCVNELGVSLTVAQKHLMQVIVHNTETKKNAIAIGFRNESGGYELFNGSCNCFVGKMDISFIRGTIPKPNGIHIFKNVRDYLAAVMHQAGYRFEDDALILNTLANLPKATPYIKGYGYRIAYTWMDNNDTGRNAKRSLAAFFRTEENLLNQPMNDIYAPHMDINAWHMHTLRLSNSEVAK